MDYARNEDYYDCLNRDLRPDGIQYQVITDLDPEPVSVGFFKTHARIDFDVENGVIEMYIAAARHHLEDWSQLSFGVKTIGLTALSLPKNYKLMYGKVDTVTTAGFTNVGDILKEGGRDIDIEYTTIGVVNDVVKTAICRYAAGLYLFRENVIETKFSGDQLFDAAKEMLKPYRNVTQW